MKKRKWELIYWNVFNIIVRFMGCWFIVGAGISFVYSTIQLIKPSSDSRLDINLISFILSLCFFVMGWFIIKVDKYYPTHIKKYIDESNREKN